MPSAPSQQLVRRLPDQPDLDHLKKQARRLQRGVRDGEPESVALVRAFEPSVSLGADFSLTTAQLVTARSYGFASWPRLRTHVQLVRELTRSPGPAGNPVHGAEAEGVPGEESGADEDRGRLADRLLRLATLNYTQDRPGVADEATAMLQRHPELAIVDVYTMAATGAATELAAALAEQPELVNTDGGPFGWVPLLYLCYARLGDGDGDGRGAVAAATVLLDAGADPNAGFLWNGLLSPFTALTGVFGGGEQDQSVHPDADRLARLLLDAGADPNDNQTLYNRMFRADDDHLALLFDYGLGTEVDSPWRRRLGDHYPTPEQMITEQLRWAADHAMSDRVELLLEHGVDPDGRGYHPGFGDRTPYQLAVLAGDRQIADRLAAAGADTSVIDRIDVLLGAAMAGDRTRVEELLRSDPGLADAAQQRQPGAIREAVGKGRIEGLNILLELGFAVNQRGVAGRTALHQAAVDGRSDLAERLLEAGADPMPLDESYHSRPSGWADHSGYSELAARLREAEAAVTAGS